MPSLIQKVDQRFRMLQDAPDMSCGLHLHHWQLAQS